MKEFKEIWNTVSAFKGSQSIEPSLKNWTLCVTLALTSCVALNKLLQLLGFILLIHEIRAWNRPSLRFLATLMFLWLLIHSNLKGHQLVQIVFAKGIQMREILCGGGVQRSPQEVAHVDGGGDGVPVEEMQTPGRKGGHTGTVKRECDWRGG